MLYKIYDYASCVLYAVYNGYLTYNNIVLRLRWPSILLCKGTVNSCNGSVSGAFLHPGSDRTPFSGDREAGSRLPATHFVPCADSAHTCSTWALTFTAAHSQPFCLQTFSVTALRRVLASFIPLLVPGFCFMCYATAQMWQNSSLVEALKKKCLLFTWKGPRPVSLGEVLSTCIIFTFAFSLLLSPICIPTLTTSPHNPLKVW